MIKITILIPCRNEEQGIGHVLSEIPYALLKKRGYDAETIVIDNNSTDRTAEIAAASGVQVVTERQVGKGNALKTGFQHVRKDSSFIVMMDGDGTYKPSELFRMLEPLESRFCHVVVGSRLGGKQKRASFRFRNRVFNWIVTFIVRQFFFANVTDVLSGYFAWRKDVIDTLSPYLVSKGFAIETEMITKLQKLGFEVYSVPITYERRRGRSKIEVVRDSITIFGMLAHSYFWEPRKSLRMKTRQLIIGLA